MQNEPYNPYSSIPGGDPYGGYYAHVYDVSEPGYLGKLARKLRKLGHASTTIPLHRLFFILPVGQAINTGLVGAAGVLEVIDSLIHGETKKAFKQTIANTVDTAATFALTGAGVVWWLGNAVFGIVSSNSLPEEARKLTGWALDKVDEGLTGPKVDPYKAAVEQNYAAVEQQVLGPSPQIAGTQTGQVAYNPALVPQQDMTYRGNYDIVQADPRALAMMEQMNQAYAPPPEQADRAAMIGQFRPDNMPHFSEQARRRGQEPQHAYTDYMRGEGREHVATLENARENQPDYSMGRSTT